MARPSSPLRDTEPFEDKDIACLFLFFTMSGTLYIPNTFWLKEYLNVIIVEK